METTEYDTIQSRARSIITLPASEALAVPSYVLSTAIMLHRSAPCDDLVIPFDHESAIREDKAR